MGLLDAMLKSQQIQSERNRNEAADILLQQSIQQQQAPGEFLRSLDQPVSEQWAHPANQTEQDTGGPEGKWTGSIGIQRPANYDERVQRYKEAVAKFPSAIKEISTVAALDPVLQAGEAAKKMLSHLNQMELEYKVKQPFEQEKASLQALIDLTKMGAQQDRMDARQLRGHTFQASGLGKQQPKSTDPMKQLWEGSRKVDLTDDTGSPIGVEKYYKRGGSEEDWLGYTDQKTGKLNRNPIPHAKAQLGNDYGTAIGLLALLDENRNLDEYWLADKVLRMKENNTLEREISRIKQEKGIKTTGDLKKALEALVPKPS